jgi:hypothetical protein
MVVSSSPWADEHDGELSRIGWTSDGHVISGSRRAFNQRSGHVPQASSVVGPTTRTRAPSNEALDTPLSPQLPYHERWSGPERSGTYPDGT